jgi:hypothetical protein
MRLRFGVVASLPTSPLGGIMDAAAPSHLSDQRAMNVALRDQLKRLLEPLADRDQSCHGAA